MAETLTEDLKQKENTAGSSPKSRLDKFLRENNVKVFTERDFNFPKDEETQAKIRAEVDDFLEMREEWRREDLETEKSEKWLS